MVNSILSWCLFAYTSKGTFPSCQVILALSQDNPMERRHSIMRQYEVAVVLRADLSDEDRSAQVDVVTNWITTMGGTVAQVDHWGRRRLAYPVARQRDGYYLLITADMPASALTDIERNLRLSENVLRYLITRPGE
jgi:small subunit ribosomal protein S6